MEEHIVTIELPADCSVIELDEKVMEKNGPAVLSSSKNHGSSLMGKIFFVDDDSVNESKDNVLMIAEQDEPINLEIKRKTSHSKTESHVENLHKVLNDNVSLEICFKDGLYLCPQCPKGFKQKNNTVAHYKMVHLKVLHQCKICGLEVKKIRQHMVDVHEPKSKETCTICGKQYDTGRLIKDHYQKTHKQRKDGSTLPLNSRTDGLVNCAVCRETISKGRIDRHMHFRHYLPPSYCVVCPLCQVKVKFIPWHMQKCHKGSNYTKELLRCKRCDQWFNNKQLFVHHQENHVEYGCDDCGEHFEKHLELAKHMFHRHEKVFNVGQKHRLSKKSITLDSPAGLFKMYDDVTVMEPEGNNIESELARKGRENENINAKVITKDTKIVENKDGTLELNEETHYVITKKFVNEREIDEPFVDDVRFGDENGISRGDNTNAVIKSENKSAPDVTLLEKSEVVYNNEILVGDEMDSDYQFETFIVHVNTDGVAEKIEDVVAEAGNLPQESEQDINIKSSSIILPESKGELTKDTPADATKNDSSVMILGNSKEDSVLISESDVSQDHDGTDLIKILMQHEGNVGHFWIHKNDPLLQRINTIDENISFGQFEAGGGVKIENKGLNKNKMLEHVVVENSPGNPLPRYLTGDNLKNIDLLANKPDVKNITLKELERFQIGVPKQTDKKNKYQTSPSRQPHLCPYCMKIMKNKGTLKRHIDVVHLGVKPFKCDECDKGFATNADRMRHKNLYHDKVEKNQLVECAICLQKFKKAYIRRHILYKHKKCQLPTKCTICEKEFKTREIMMRHVRLIHYSDKKLQKCKLCGLKVKNLKRHGLICQKGSNSDAGDITVYSKDGKQLVVEKMLKLGQDPKQVVGELILC